MLEAPHKRNISQVWFRPRELPPTYRDIESMPRLVPGTEPRQRPADQEVKPLGEKQEDTLYHRFHMMVGSTTLSPIIPM